MNEVANSLPLSTASPTEALPTGAASTMGWGVMQKVRPLNFLAQLVSSSANGRLRVLDNSVVWSVHLENGKIIYASHSVQPQERLDLHLRRMGYQISFLVNEAFNQIRGAWGANNRDAIDHSDYHAICLLVNQGYLNPVEAAGLIENLAKEVFESFLLVQSGECEFIETEEQWPKFCRLDLHPLIESCRKRLQAWQNLGPQIWSPYQRPYFFSQAQSQQKIAPDLQRKLGAILKGYSFRTLGVLLNKDELVVANSLRGHIQDGVILLREPQPPFDLLPRIPHRREDTAPPREESPIDSLAGPPSGPLPSPPTAQASPSETATKIYKIACIDDSPSILQEMKRFLSDESFDVFAINDPLKALMQVIRLKPDLILLDIGMPGIDGYKLCRLLRNHSSFSNTPIVMVTGNTGIIDRAKAKFVGATGYLTKPFTKSELLRMVFTHLV